MEHKVFDFDFLQLINKYNQRGETIEKLRNQVITLNCDKQRLQNQINRLRHDNNYQSKCLDNDKLKQTFGQNQWERVIRQINKNHVQEIQHLKKQQKNFTPVNHQKQIYQAQKLASQMKKINYHKKVETINQNLSEKLKQNKQIIRILVGKIYSQELQLKKELSKNKTQPSKVQYQTDANLHEIILKDDVFMKIKLTLRDNLLKNIYESFLRSFQQTKNVPNISIFVQNINQMQLTLTRQILQCYFYFLKLQPLEINSDEINSNELWIYNNLQQIKNQRLKRHSNYKIVYLFRCLTTLFRINASFSHLKMNAESKIANRVKQAIIFAYYDYQYNQLRK